MKINKFIKILSYGIAVISVMPILFYVKSFYTIIFFISLLLSLKFEFRKRIYLNIFAIIAIMLTVSNLSINNLIIKGIESVLILLSVKFLESKKFRDYMQIYTLSIFAIAGYSLLTINIFFIFYLASILLLLSIAAVFLTYFDVNETVELPKNTFIKIAYKSSFIFLFSLPLTALIFIILPRIESPFFDFLNSDKTALTGFSDKIQLGDITTISQDNSVIFRVKMKKIPDNLLYWRGAVLDKFNGTVWSRSKFRDLQDNYGANFLNKSLRVKQEIYLEPYYGKYLFALELPVKIIFKKVKTDSSHTTVYHENILKRMIYTAYSVPAKKFVEQNIDKNKYLQTPAHIIKKIKFLSKRLRSDNKLKTVENIKRFFINNHFVYTLTNLPQSKLPVKNFLFGSKKGNCEYFASAFALLCRISDIPARIVAGYKGGEYSELGGYYIVRQSNAHVWVEVYISGKWLTVDPVDFAFNTTGGKLTHSGKSLIKQIKISFDLINYYYIVFLVNYSFQNQINILKTITKIPNYKFSLNKNLLSILISLLFLSFAFVKIKSFLFYDYEKKLVKKFLLKLYGYGYKREKGETLEEVVKKIKEENLKIKSEKFVKIFEDNYFKDKNLDRKEIRKLYKIINKL